MKGMDTDLLQKPQASTQPTAFVDVSVIGAYLAGGEAASRLFGDRYRDGVRFAVDPVVLQEMLVLPQVKESPELLETMRDHVNFEILPLDIERSQQLLQRAKALRNGIVHSSGLLVAASARDCDYLITYDPALKELIEGDRPRVVTPEQFTSLMPAP
ncbi:MAG: PIN domain nuclease [Chloroflexi bacterium]|nr:MAG: PIN domain nuclease [Chloroflexota bacterium]